MMLRKKSWCSKVFHHPAILPCSSTLSFREVKVSDSTCRETRIPRGKRPETWRFFMGGHVCFYLIHPSCYAKLPVFFIARRISHGAMILHMTFHVVFPCPDQHRTWTCRALPAPAKMQMSTFHQAGHGSKLDASKFQRDIHRIGCFMMANRLDWQYQLIFLNKNKTPK